MKVQAQHIEQAQKRPDVGRRDRSFLTFSDDLAECAAILDRLFRDTAVRRQPVREFRTIACRTGAIQETDEVFEEGIGAPPGYEYQAVMLRGELVRVLEVPPEILNGLFAFFVCRTDGEGPFDLTGEFPIGCIRTFTDNQKVVGMPAEELCLEVDLRYARLDQDRRNTAHEQLCQPVHRDVLLEEGAGSTRGGRARYALSGQGNDSSYSIPGTSPAWLIRFRLPVS